MAQLNHDQSQVQPLDDFSPLPAGKYNVIVEKVEDRLSKSSPAEYTNFTLSVLDGEFKGRKIFDKYFYANVSQKCLDYNQRKLQGLIAASGFQITNTLQLTNVITVVDIKKTDDGNEVNSYICKTIPSQVNGTINNTVQQASPVVNQQPVAPMQATQPQQAVVNGEIPSWEQ